MSMGGTITDAKASSAEDRSGAIIVSFDSRWHDALNSGRISCIIRKRIPKDAYEWLYVHVNSPIGAICGRAKINSACGITLIEAVNLADEIGLSEKEISSYVGNGNSIGCYRIGSFELAMNPKKTGEINKLVNYNPPQSFLILSKPAKQIIDEMSEFCSIPAEGAES